ncbi:hypothetical protein [Nocardia tengchongensis]
MLDLMQESALERWRNALHELTATEAVAESWRHERYRFAHKLGHALAGPGQGVLPMSGSVLYGVWLDWGLLYVGQTGNAERRLRDLPVGESHHLSNTFPPEIWSQVIVIAWPQLPEAAGPIDLYGLEKVSLGLEYRLQAWLHPLANASRRTPDGKWRAVDWTKSRSRGAVTGGQIDDLFAAVQKIWKDPSNSTVCRVVHPADLL